MAYLDKVKAMTMKIKYFRIQQIFREKNKQADVLANLAFTFDLIASKNVPLELFPNPSIDIVKTNVFQTTIESIWLDDVAMYLKSVELPFDKLRAHKIQYQ